MSRTPAKFTQADVAREMSRSVVYFIRIGKEIKIGVTTNLERRMKEFLTSTSDIKLLIAVPGDRFLERKLHELLAEAHITRELFIPDYRVMGFIDHFEYGGLPRALEFLEATTPAARARRKQEDFRRRVASVRQTKAEKDAYFASLVAERKRRLGW